VQSRLLTLIRKEFIQIIRDPRTLILTFVFPIVMLFLLGYAATNDVRNIPLAVYDQDKSAESMRLLEAYQAADYFKIAYDVNSPDELRRLMDNGSVRAGIIIPPDYAEAVSTGEKADIAFIIDGSDPTLASTALSAATLIGQAKSTNLVTKQMMFVGQGGSQSLVEVRTQVWYNPELVSANFMIPGLIGMILQFLTTMLTSTAIVREREYGTIEQLIVTPIRPWELVVGKITPYVLIGFFDTIEVLVIGVLVFHITISGSLLLLLLLCALFLVTTLGIGILISTVAKTQQEAMLTTMMTILPSVFLSGFFFPLAAMPTVLQAISYLIPLRYFLIIVRGIVLKGVGMESLYFEVLLLAIYGTIIMTLAAVRFRKKLD
jgi:ABC-2 type transport system permease protein